MPSRVTPNETPVHGDQELWTSAQATRNDVSVVVNIQEQENVNEQLLRQLDEIYSPVLKLMKLFGIYLGDASLKSIPNNSGRCEKMTSLSCIYCVVVVSGFWLLFIVYFSGIFVENVIFMFLMFSFWNLFIALNGTMTLALLRSTGTTKSRFQNFLLRILSVIKDVNLEKVKAKSRKGVIMFLLFFVTFLVLFVASNVVININFGMLYPWNKWFGFRVLFAVFINIGAGTWVLSIIFFAITCLLLEECFGDLHKRMLLLHPLSVDLAKSEYHKLCEVVEFADRMLSPLLLVLVSLFIPLLCFCFYNLVNLPEEGWLVFLVSNLVCLLIAAGILAVAVLFASKVSEKV